MKTYSNMDELDKDLLKIIEKAVKSEGNFIEKDMKNNVQKVVYNPPNTPSMYTRSYDLMNSVEASDTKVEGNNVEVEVKNDTSKIYPNADLHQHYNIVPTEYSPDAIAEHIPEIVIDGTSGHVLGTGFWTEPRDYVGATLDDLQKDDMYVKKFAEYLKSQGLNVEII